MLTFNQFLFLIESNLDEPMYNLSLIWESSSVVISTSDMLLPAATSSTTTIYVFIWMQNVRCVTGSLTSRVDCQLPVCRECYINNHLHSQCQVAIVLHFQEKWWRSRLSVTQRGSAKNCRVKLLTLKHTHPCTFTQQNYLLGWLAMNVSHRCLTGCWTLTTDSSPSSSRSIWSHYQNTYFLQPVLSTFGPAPAGTCLHHLPEEVSNRHLNRCLSPLSCLRSAWGSSDSIHAPLE